MNIVTSQGAVTIDGYKIAKNLLQFRPFLNPILVYKGDKVLYRVNLEDITADGETFATPEEFNDWLDANAFKVGGGSGTGAAWGEITGTLTNQIDLRNALNGKATSAQGALAETAVQPEDLGQYAVIGTGAGEVRSNTDLDERYLQSFTESDPTVPTHVKEITQANINAWNAKQNALTLMTQAEAEGGTSTTARTVSALRIAQAIAALALTSSDTSTSALEDTVPLRKSNGRVETGTAVDGADAVNLTQFATALDAKVNRRFTIIATSDASFTYDLIHAEPDVIVRTTGGGAKTHTIPPQSSVAWPDGVAITLAAVASAVTIEAGAGVNIISAEPAPLVVASNTMATLVRVGVNEWVLAARFAD